MFHELNSILNKPSILLVFGGRLIFLLSDSIDWSILISPKSNMLIKKIQINTLINFLNSMYPSSFSSYALNDEIQ